MPQKKKTARRSPKDLKTRIRPEDRAIHILMPYILGLLALFFGLCFILGEEKLGFLGKASILLQGLFSVGAFAFPILLLLHACFYKRDLAAGSHLYKFWFSFGDMTFLGVLYALFTETEPTWEAAANFKGGVDLTTGGLIGGTCLKLLDTVVGIFTPVIAVLGIGIFTTFLFGKTPADLIRSIFIPLGEKMKVDHDERQERRILEREKREEERLRLAQARAEQGKEEFREEKKSGKKKKCRAMVDTGEEVTGDAPEDRVSDDEVKIRLKEEEEEPEQIEPAREIIPIEEMESEPVPDLRGEPAGDFTEPVSQDPVTYPREEEDFSREEEEVKKALAEKYEEDAVEEKTPLSAEEEENDDIEDEYRFPTVSLLAAAPPANPGSRTEQENTARKLVETLESFGVKTTVCGISKGPAVTRYELQPQRGVRVRSIVNLTDDIALATASGGVRIEAPIPGKEAVGIEVPNKERDTVYVRELIDNPEFNVNSSRLNCALGKDVAGNFIYCDLAKMPHILIAGATGMGKSVCLNSLIVSMLYRATPDEVQMILIDPKKVEMSKYNGIPHLLVPVVSDAKKAAGALNWAVIEMERRFILLEELGVRDIKGYNAAAKNDPDRKSLSHIVIIIDELADLMMTAKNEVETSICRLAQKARAAGMHIVIGTQRPSVDVITGLIKANVPSRIACTVASQVDSRTIIDNMGAEKLLGKGDMLYAPVGSSKPLRVQGCFVSDDEVEAVCDAIRAQRTAAYDETVCNLIEREAQKCGEKKKGGFSDDEGPMPGAVGLFADKDPLLEKAIDIAVAEKKVSTSLLQRKLSVGYARAAKLIDFMAEMNVVGEYAGSKPREVLWTEQYYTEYKMRACEDQPID